MDAFKKAAEAAYSGAKANAGKVGTGGGGGGNGPLKLIGSLATVAGGLAIASYGLYNSMVTVTPGHQGIIYNRFSFGTGAGIQEGLSMKEGLNFVIPWFQRPIIFDIRTRPKLINSTSGSKDLQMVEISLRVLFKPDHNQLPFIYRRLGQDFDERVLPSIVNEVTKAVVAQHNASELLTKREGVSRRIRELLTKRAADFHLLLDDVAITHLAFSKDYTAAVEAKQVSQQEAEQAKYVVEKALEEKKSIIIKAEGEAESAKLIGKAISQNPAFVQLRRIDAAREVAHTLSASTNKIYLNADTLQLNQLGDSNNLAPRTAGSSESSSTAPKKSSYW